MKIFKWFFIALVMVWPMTGYSATQAEIRRSIANYKGSCPCPYSVDRAGRKCGRRSAYSRPGGAQPLCYPSD